MYSGNTRQEIEIRSEYENIFAEVGNEVGLIKFKYKDYLNMSKDDVRVKNFQNKIEEKLKNENDANFLRRIDAINALVKRDDKIEDKESFFKLGTNLYKQVVNDVEPEVQKPVAPKFESVEEEVSEYDDENEFESIDDEVSEYEDNNKFNLKGILAKIKNISKKTFKTIGGAVSKFMIGLSVASLVAMFIILGNFGTFMPIGLLIPGITAGYYLVKADIKKVRKYLKKNNIKLNELFKNKDKNKEEFEKVKGKDIEKAIEKNIEKVDEKDIEKDEEPAIVEPKKDEEEIKIEEPVKKDEAVAVEEDMSRKDVEYFEDRILADPTVAMGKSGEEFKKNYDKARIARALDEENYYGIGEKPLKEKLKEYKEALIDYRKWEVLLQDNPGYKNNEKFMQKFNELKSKCTELGADMEINQYMASLNKEKNHDIEMKNQNELSDYEKNKREMDSMFNDVLLDADVRIQYENMLENEQDVETLFRRR